VAVQGGVAGSAGVIVYLLAAYILRVPELHNLIASLRRRFLRLGNTGLEPTPSDTL
jgi:multisubunit Na+/H+ antiporter MnhB subunit